VRKHDEKKQSTWISIAVWPLRRPLTCAGCSQTSRLLAQRMWINEAPKATLTELENQIAQIKTVLLELEIEIQDQLKRVQ
jgi:hypothetical protein